MSVLLLGACSTLPPEPRETSAGHLGERPAPAVDIPAPVRRVPVLPPPEPAPAQETYTVVVNEVPVKELLFALARDASMNVDIHPDITGSVTLNAIDQTLPQILDRISRQVDLRYRIDGTGLEIAPDAPFLRIYKVDYLNMTRAMTSKNSITTQVASAGATTGIGGAGAGGGGGGASTNNSEAEVSSESVYALWETLRASVQSLLAASDPATLPGAARRAETDDVIINRESGVLMVNATERQHLIVREYLDTVLASAGRQVLIEATVVEVELSDRYQAGIDWNRIALGAGFTISQALLGGFTAPQAGTTGLLLNYRNDDPAEANLDLTVRLLKEFGDARVLSSPKLMVLNNQTAQLKVVDNIVYFEVDVERIEGTANNAPRTNTDTTVRTVPVGFSMNVTPFVGDADAVTLNVRPTISRIVRFVNDPNPDLAAAGAVNPIPEIRTRELESMLRIPSGQIAVLGGLMQDVLRKDTAGLPGLSELPDVGEAFKFRDHDFVKTELVIFIRPTVIRTPSIDADLADFRAFLPANLEPARAIDAPPVEAPQ